MNSEFKCDKPKCDRYACFHYTWPDGREFKVCGIHRAAADAAFDAAVAVKNKPDIEEEK